MTLVCLSKYTQCRHAAVLCFLPRVRRPAVYRYVDEESAIRRIFFPSFHSAYRKRLRLVRAICGGRNCKKLSMLTSTNRRRIVPALLKHNNIKIIIFIVILYCARAYEKRAFGSHWKACESERR